MCAELKRGEYHLFDPVEGGFHRYGTTRKWTPPHYEKILGDNMRLLRAYAHLVRIHPRHDTARTVVNMVRTRAAAPCGPSLRLRA